MEIKEMKIIKDGNSWCFVLPDFENLQVSPAFFTEGFRDMELEYELDNIYNILKSDSNK